MSLSSLPRPSEQPAIRLRAPQPTDGAAVHALIDACPPLDANSVYCNLLQCTHFAGTCVIAERAGEVVGFVSGYLRPERPETLFIWQVAVAASARGARLGRRMLLEVLARPDCAGVRFISTTITADNDPSWALFAGLARSLGADSQRRLLFERARHFAGVHATEHELLIGPLQGAASPPNSLTAEQRTNDE